MKLPGLNSLMYFALALMFLLVANVNAVETQSVEFKSVPVFQGDNAELHNLEGFLTKPDGKGPFPAVVLLHTCGGPSETTTKFWPAFLAKQGYVTLAVDSMGPRGINPGRCQPLLKNKKLVSRDAYGALEYLAGLPYVNESKVAAIGYSLGGIVINFFARQEYKTPKGLNFRAAISVYGHCSIRRPGSPAYTSSPKIPLIFVLGDKEQPRFFDSCINVERFPDTERHVLKGIYHAFDNPDYTSIREDSAGNPMLYSEKGTKQAMEVIKNSLAKYILKGEAPLSNIEMKSQIQASDEPVGPTGRTPSQVISFMDKDGDDKISESEWRGPERSFNFIDINKDGYLVREEFIAKWR